MLHGAWRSWTHLLCICFCMCCQQKPKTPNLSPMADDAITWGGIRGLGSPLYICKWLWSTDDVQIFHCFRILIHWKFIIFVRKSGPFWQVRQTVWLHRSLFVIYLVKTGNKSLYTIFNWFIVLELRMKRFYLSVNVAVNGYLELTLLQGSSKIRRHLNKESWCV